MRLGDLDALIRTHKSEVATIGKDWTVDDLATAIETAPTIDAIPVEWLIQRMLRSDDESDMEMRDCISVLVDEYQKEQEAK